MSKPTTQAYEEITGAENHVRDREARKQMLSLSQVLRDVVEVQLAPRLGHAIDVRMDIDPVLAPVLACRDDLERICHDLCANAIDAMPDGGTLTLRLRRHADDIRLVVEDTGSGVPPDVDVFQPLLSSKPRHPGLGLPMVRHLVKELGGTIHFESTPGKGTTFVVGLPAHRGEPPT